MSFAYNVDVTQFVSTKIFIEGKRHLFADDRNETDFLDAVRNLEIEGMLIDDIHLSDLLGASLFHDDESFFQPTKYRNFLKEDNNLLKNYRSIISFQPVVFEPIFFIFIRMEFFILKLNQREKV